MSESECSIGFHASPAAVFRSSSPGISFVSAKSSITPARHLNESSTKNKSLRLRPSIFVHSLRFASSCTFGRSLDISRHFLSAVGQGSESIVIVARRKKFGSAVPSAAPGYRGQPPEATNEFPEFYIFARTNQAKIWYPCGALQGDNSSKLLVTSLRNSWGKKLYSGTLDRRIATAVFGQRQKLVNELALQVPATKKYQNELEFGYRIRMKGHEDDGVRVITKPEPTIIDKIRNFFNFNKNDEGGAQVSTVGKKK
mmetsp:Transcript_17761/g.29205  ORF Transcript_17761/g.29205 Transcript_17761/m.29205 type:complete len:255 (-) Transcript_17761:389-1153(-)|eukprot:CAMPEP_0184644102 /NCGR_PEP_ID=MMETSP0308-20130426/867_1 /TAXON_ID=38269 /ORGANISM="Gloeochaete witrockiana, Strain SAG 46.84" /LENGTH=254 /DNA_ID=CAMNT_0027072433 /DNA_START=166 /DNA_END=930 /DNA_ORIENTATION=+